MDYNPDNAEYDNDRQRQLQAMFDSFIKAIADSMGRNTLAQVPPEPISGTRKNRLAQFLKLDSISQEKQSVTTDEFLMQVVIALKDVFADCYITIEERSNTLSIQLSNNEMFYLKITKDQ